MIGKTHQVHQQDQATHSTKTSTNIRLLLRNEINNWQINWLLYNNLLTPFARSQKSLHKHIVSNSGCKLTIAIFWTKFAKKGSYFLSKTNKIDTTVEFCIFELVFVYQISLWTNNFEFWDQICPRQIFILNNRKSELHHWILIIQISLGTKFQFKLTILIFLTRRGFSGLKQKKWTPHIFYIILHIQISLARNFSSNWQFSFFGSNLHKKVFLVKNWKKLTSWLNSAYSN